MSRAPRACLYVEYLYPVVSGGRVPFAGGIEVQLNLMGQGLARRGWDVRAVTCDYGQPDPFVAGGITLHKCYPPTAGLPVVRFLHPRLTLGVSALWRADADVYLFRGASLWAGIVAMVARARGRRFVWLTGHDHDVMTRLPDVHGPRDRSAVRYAIRHADAIITQTRWQHDSLLAEFGRESTVIMNSVEVPPATEVLDAGAGTDLVWLSTYKPEKRPEWFTRFAERHPNVRCRMAGVVPLPPLDDRAYHVALEARSRAAGLEVRGLVPRHEVPDFLKGAAVFAHSSPAEGFPNTLLECWARGIPSVSSFDPDGIVEREGLGACRTDYESWERAIEERLADAERRRREGARARAWVERHHAPDVVHDALHAVLESCR